MSKVLDRNLRNWLKSVAEGWRLPLDRVPGPKAEAAHLRQKFRSDTVEEIRLLDIHGMACVRHDRERRGAGAGRQRARRSFG